MKAKINATINFVPHADPRRATDVWANLIVKEILKLEGESAEKGVTK